LVKHKQKEDPDDDKIYDSPDLKIIDLNQKLSVSSNNVLEEFRNKMAKARELEDKLTENLVHEKKIESLIK